MGFDRLGGEIARFTKVNISNGKKMTKSSPIIRPTEPCSCLKYSNTECLVFPVTKFDGLAVLYTM